jgi:hypothetical protein
MHRYRTTIAAAQLWIIITIVMIEMEIAQDVERLRLLRLAASEVGLRCSKGNV